MPETLVRLCEDGGGAFLYRKRDFERYMPDTPLAASQDNFTATELVQYCEERTESANYHSLCGVFSPLADMLVEEVGADAAVRVLLRIATELDCLM